MGYCERDSVVRIDRFKPRGKWYDSIALDMADFYNEPMINEAVKKAMDAQDVSWKHFIIVCLEPYHVNSHPVMLKSHIVEASGS